MKSLKLLNNLIFHLLLIIAFSAELFSEEPVDIWKGNSDLKKNSAENIKEDLALFVYNNIGLSVWLYFITYFLCVVTNSFLNWLKGSRTIQYISLVVVLHFPLLRHLY